MCASDAEGAAFDGGIRPGVGGDVSQCTARDRHQNPQLDYARFNAVNLVLGRGPREAGGSGSGELSEKGIA